MTPTALKTKILVLFAGIIFVLPISCKDKVANEPPVILRGNYLALDVTSTNQLDVQTNGANQYKLKTTGGDPYLFSSPLRNANEAANVVLTFEYKSSKKLNTIQVFLAPPLAEDRSVKTGTLNATSTWKTLSIDLGSKINDLSWGKIGHFIRLDFGDEAGADIEIKNIQLRNRNEQEAALAKEKEEFRQNDQQWNDRIANYLQQDYPNKITLVAVTTDHVRIEGVLSGAQNPLLVEVKPSDELTEKTHFDGGVAVSGPTFSLELDRYVEQGGIRYDRALSKWMVVEDEQNQQRIRSHARYPDRIPAKNVMHPQKMKSRKGLGGFDFQRGFHDDLECLAISSVTVNVPVTSLLYLNERPNTYVHQYGGKNYYFDKTRIAALDKTFQTAASKDIIVSAIILVQKASDAADPKVGELMEHLQFSGEAFFTMPRLDNPESVNLYAAILDFLAARYCRPDNQYGRIHHWILHNEVDVGTVWTNMGHGRPMHVFLDAYYKSMRMCYTIARTYDEHAEVFASLTHSWSKPSLGGGDYATLDLLNGLLAYSRAEGDFQWALACHPYPEDLNEPKTWNDAQATFSMNSPLVTFKNLEVLDAWIKMPAHKYQQSTKRTLWLSENGTNSPTYSQQDLLEQAAGFAYAWKKFKQLDGIDAIQWHNWIDNRAEFGLHIGLRRFPDDAEDPGGKKPVWYAYQAAGTDQEDEIFEPYKAIIGISNWDEIMKDVGAGR